MKKTKLKRIPIRTYFSSPYFDYFRFMIDVRHDQPIDQVKRVQNDVDNLAKKIFRPGKYTFNLSRVLLFEFLFFSLRILLIRI